VRLRSLLATAVCAALALPSATARAQGLSPVETDSLWRGETVSRTREIQHEGRHYVGGVTYTIVNAPAADVTALLDDVRTWRRFVPKTREARLIGPAGDNSLVEVTQGSALFKVAYTLRVRRDGNVLRFWIDPSRPHDIEDAWGFFRAEPMPNGQTLVTYGVLIDIGSGLIRDMFERRVRDLALEVPDNLRALTLQGIARGERALR
jgi:hypothetical protein